MVWFALKVTKLRHIAHTWYYYLDQKGKGQGHRQMGVGYRPIARLCSAPVIIRKTRGFDSAKEWKNCL